MPRMFAGRSPGVKRTRSWCRHNEVHPSLNVDIPFGNSILGCSRSCHSARDAKAQARQLSRGAIIVGSAAPDVYASTLHTAMARMDPLLIEVDEAPTSPRSSTSDSMRASLLRQREECSKAGADMLRVDSWAAISFFSDAHGLGVRLHGCAYRTDMLIVSNTAIPLAREAYTRSTAAGDTRVMEGKGLMIIKAAKTALRLASYRSAQLPVHVMNVHMSLHKGATLHVSFSCLRLARLPASLLMPVGCYYHDLV
ncbi:hypothetical protein JKP88DRAFT_245812 [Tribonema minus]|uniref:Uncharacterized protein n=1 Tax=Tribonema minus TaxID=303371 RepID=A0A835Z4I7_9STRA|nr:hypothetical protein JKP88DRAFT_245812 [Tribonema minus]